ncbi:MAG TPA: MFS transporter [Galbitalea sp.]|nr:MFS transporter [Galbitalea sp.]
MSTAEPAMTQCISLGSQHRRFVLPPAAAFAGVAIAYAGLYLAAGAPSPLFVQYQQQWGFPAGLLTIAFAAYAFGLVAAILVAGSLSDFIGRRPVLIGALAIELVSMLMFIVAPNIGWVIAARVVQGLATGGATSAFAASLLELAPAKFRNLGAVIGAAAPAGGLGLGALLAGIAVQFTTEASVIVFTGLASIMVLGGLVAIFARETVARRPGGVRSLQPRIVIPAAARGEFAATIPVLLGAWMLAALFIGLAPTIIQSIFHIDSGFVNGITVFIEPGAAAVIGFVLGRVAARRTILIGGAGVFVGTAIIVAGIGLEILPLIWLGGIIGGVGFGASFSGSLRILGPFAQPNQRAELFAAVFLVAYLAFGIPAIIVGQLVAPFGLLATVIGFGGVTLVAAFVGILVQLRFARKSLRA